MNPKSTNALIGGIVVCFVVVVAACAAVYMTNPGDDALGFVTPVLGFTGTTLALLAAMAKVGEVDKKVDYLANGGTDAKVRAGIADVVKSEFLKDEVEDLIEADRAHRDASPAGGSATPR